MNYTFTEEKLVLRLQEGDKELLQTVHDEDPEAFGSDNTMFDFFEHLIANSELDWVQPEETGDLTSAPLLGIISGQEVREEDWENYPEPVYGWRYCGGDEKGAIYNPIVNRWGWEPYQVEALLDHLLKHGEATLVAGW